MKYTEIELREKTLTELRKIGGSVGVAKYSRKQAEELISLILAIQEGEVEPAVMKRGRPRKDAHSQSDFLQEQKKESRKSVAEVSQPVQRVTVYPTKPQIRDFTEENQRRNEGCIDFRNNGENGGNYQNRQKVGSYDDYVNSRIVQPKQPKRDPLRQKSSGDWKIKTPDGTEKTVAEQTDRSQNVQDGIKNFDVADGYQNPAKSDNYEGQSVSYGEESWRESRKPIKYEESFDVQQDFDVSGIVEVMPDGYGLLRTVNYYPSDADVYIPAMQIKRFQLRNGDKLNVRARPFPNNRYPSAIFIYSINDVPCDQLTARVNFEDLTPIYPMERIRLEDGQHQFDVALRAIDLVSPIGRGQRGLIVSPPKAGKTVLLKSIAQAILRNYDDIHVIILLVDERPEEVTDIRESVDGAEIVYSTFDMTPEHHTKVAELVMQRAKRMVEIGKHVVILLDSITRLSRAYNQVTEQTGKTLTGGLDSAALYEPKRFFGAARNIKGGGSLTVIATALVDTGSKMDDIIYEEFKGTGNMEIHLSRKMSERRIFPAIDLNKSGTRREELLLNANEQEGMWILRRILSKADNADATEKILDMLLATKTNEEFLEYVRSKIGTKQNKPNPTL